MTCFTDGHCARRAGSRSRKLRSTASIVAPESSMAYACSGNAQRMFTLCGTPLAQTDPYISSSTRSELRLRIATLSPVPRPSCSKPPAQRATRSASSPKVVVRSPYTSAGLSGMSTAQRRTHCVTNMTCSSSDALPAMPAKSLVCGCLCSHLPQILIRYRECVVVPHRRLRRRYVGHRMLGHRGDGQRWVDARVRRHRRPIAYEQIFVSEDTVTTVDDAS